MTMGNKFTDEQKAMLLWKLAPGDANKVMSGQSPVPSKERIAGPEDIKEEKVSDDCCKTVRMDLHIPTSAMHELEKGHIPEMQEDHWFMYCRDGIMRWYRSWTGIRVFEARYHKDENDYVIEDIKVTVGIPDVPLAGPQSAGDLFMVLCLADAGADFWPSWNLYVEDLEKGE